MELFIAESEIEPVIKSIILHLTDLVLDKEPNEEMFNLYRVLHRHWDMSHSESPIPEIIDKKDITDLLSKYN